MRFKLHLRPVRNNQKLTFNYQKGIQAWIYQLIQKADNEYAGFLHETGYQIPQSKKAFKHFTFSSLVLGKCKPVMRGDDFIELSQDSIYLTVSFYVTSTEKNFIVGVFQNQKISIFDKNYEASFMVERIESLPIAESFSVNDSLISVNFKTMSPLVLAEDLEEGCEYLSPIDERFEKLFALNLFDKYRSVAHSGDNNLLLDGNSLLNLISFKLISESQNIRKKGMILKEFKSEKPIRVVGYDKFSFEVTAPPSILEIGYLGGFGRNNAMGCGFVEII